MAGLIRRFPKLLPVPRGVADVTLGDISLVVDALLSEEKQRPKLVVELGRFSSLLAEYLTLSEDQKEKLEEFRVHHSGYFSGGGSGDSICYLSRPKDKTEESLARRTRCASQLLKIFDFYCENSAGKFFHNGYIVHDTELRKKHGTMGLQLYKAVSQNDMTIADIVDIVSDVRPMIRAYYRLPEERYVYRADVIELVRK